MGVQGRVSESSAHRLLRTILCDFPLCDAEAVAGAAVGVPRCSVHVGAPLPGPAKKWEHLSDQPGTAYRRERKPYGYWTRERQIEALVAFRQQAGRIPTTDDLRSNPELPAPTSVVNKFGNYTTALIAAGLAPRPQDLRDTTRRILAENEQLRLNEHHLVSLRALEARTAVLRAELDELGRELEQAKRNVENTVATLNARPA